MDDTRPKATGFKKHLPNIATFTRLLGTFSLPFLISYRQDVGSIENVPLYWFCAYMFLVLTDHIDGTLARKLHAESDFGAGLDAFSDTVLLFMGAATTFTKFVRESLTDFQFYLYIGLLLFCTFDKLGMMLVAKKYFGVPNMLHSYPQKAFAVGCYLGVGYWAFIGTVPAWSIVFLMILNFYGMIDEVVYCMRAKEYDVDFKGHGFQKYEVRQK
ncbi:MAG: CDP-alcohol phosphatidyltransferase family protein [Oscillospiraceae bacterium]|nr:CDP-alcohol phosphatidyltransferase family protein [Oscillospiraceae bacterium]